MWASHLFTLISRATNSHVSIYLHFGAIDTPFHCILCDKFLYFLFSLWEKLSRRRKSGLNGHIELRYSRSHTVYTK